MTRCKRGDDPFRCGGSLPSLRRQAEKSSGLYALYSGFVVLSVNGITFAPIVHHFLHRLHAEAGGD